MKKAKKTKEKKVIIAKVDKTKAFDLSFTSQEENLKIIVALENLKYSAGWIFLTQVFEENIKHIGNQIITKIGESGELLTDQDVDRLRDKYSYLKELLEKPEFFIKKLRIEDTVQINLDPYDS